MASINTIVKRKQYLWLGIVVVGTASAIGGALYLSDVDMSGNGETVAEQEPVPDMTGVVESNIFADWAASRQGCTVGGKSDSVRDKASDKDKERVTKNINIMWNALSKNRMFDGNKELKEFVMTLTGSLVFGPNGEITPLSARTTDRSINRTSSVAGRHGLHAGQYCYR